VAIEAIRKHKAAYLMAVGARLPRVEGDPVVARGRVRRARMEAIYEFEVKDMPVTVAVDSRGTSVHNTAPVEWAEKIARSASRARRLSGMGRTTPSGASCSSATVPWQLVHSGRRGLP